jgi:hypothetical protein
MVHDARISSILTPITNHNRFFSRIILVIRSNLQVTAFTWLVDCTMDSFIEAVANLLRIHGDDFDMEELTVAREKLWSDVIFAIWESARIRYLVI